MGHHLDKAFQRIKDKGLKLTNARRDIIQVLVQEHGPFSVDEIYSKLSVKSCDIATIYRNINVFLDSELVSQCDFGDGTARYEYKEEGEHHHHHIICRSCHQTETLDYCFVKEVERMIEDKGYKQVSHSLEFYGLCHQCQKA